ncbi:unnamed protein product [Phytomonas sp. EM1]|nr:unnamed protein product [Phytomonas sp. EM1]|eukprot:CCW64735.1 unnamed protein product [Phytomonas sp. isolate EM1]
MAKRIRRPREPSVGECCGSGCTRCVYDVYYDALKAYEEQKLSSNEDDEESVESSSEEEDDAKDYIGSVVIKYLNEMPPKDVARAEDRIHKELESKYTPLGHIQLVKSSDTGVDAPSINILSAQPVSGIPIPYPGDVVEILVPNDHPALENCVEHLCERLMVNPNAGCVLQCSPFVPEDQFPPWLPMDVPLTVRQLLSNYVDISSCSYLLRPTFFQSLLRLYNNDQQRGGSGATTLNATSSLGTPDLLKRCASVTDGVEVFRCISNSGNPLCYPSLMDVLDLFPFVKLPLERMLEITGPLQPRKFSIANHEALLDDQAKSVELCLRRVVSHRRASSKALGGNETALHLANLLNNIAIQRAARNEMSSSFFFGHTTNPLVWEATRGGARQFLERKVYMGTSLFGTSSFSRELKKALFHLVSGSIERCAAPVIMLGAGTGIAPLIAGVRELMRGRREKGVAISSAPYPCMVMYGSKSKAELVYHEELLSAWKCGAINSYEYALSRQADGGKGGERVTDLMEKNADYIRESLLCLQGKLFCCGPAKAMESIRSLLEKKILADPDDDESMQQHRIHFLTEKKQIMFDVWTAIDFMS